MTVASQTMEMPPAPLIFVVDDEPLVAEVVETILDLEGYRTRVFLEPEKALDELMHTEASPDLLLTDFRMPNMNGMELIRRSKEKFPELKSILFSGHVDENVMATQSARPDRFMRKPFFPETLLEMIHTLVPPRAA
ncbi:MAG: response regulator [Verrucomicrobiota bacterium]